MKIMTITRDRWNFSSRIEINHIRLLDLQRRQWYDSICLDKSKQIEIQNFIFFEKFVKNLNPEVYASYLFVLHAMSENASQFTELIIL
jgi:hypothetical protein